MKSRSRSFALPMLTCTKEEKKGGGGDIQVCVRVCWCLP